MVGRWLLAASLFGIAAATMFPEQGIGGRYFHWRMSTTPRALLEMVLNAVLFGPMGIALERIGFSLAASAAISASVSTAIELSQLYLIPGRYSELQDIIANTAGGVLGWLLAAAIARNNQERRDV